MTAAAPAPASVRKTKELVESWDYCLNIFGCWKVVRDWR